MRYLASYERSVRGTFDFPIELYYVDSTHLRYEMPYHWHMEHELVLVLQGTLHLAVDGTQYDLAAGDSLMIPDGAIHGGTPDSCIYECVVFDLERFMPDASKCGTRLADLRASGARLEYRFSAGSTPATLASDLFQSMETENSGYEFTTTGLLWQLLGEILVHRLYRTTNSENLRQSHQIRAVKNVLNRIRNDYAKSLTLQDLASEAGLNPNYFCRSFRQVTGKTPMEYLNYYRIECAAELLCNTQDSITDIAFQCGFQDSSYFGRIFRRMKATTPRAYRKAHKK